MIPHYKTFSLHRVCVCHTKCTVTVFKRNVLLGNVKSMTPLACAQVWHDFRDEQVTSVALARKKELVMKRIQNILVYFYNIFVVFVIMSILAILAIRTSYDGLTKYSHVSPQPNLSEHSILNFRHRASCI